jgi:hypothetical protein
MRQIRHYKKGMSRKYLDAIENREKLIASIHAQLERINRMDESLYDDKLAGEISQGKYDEKHAQFVDERKLLNERLEKLDGSVGLRLEHTLVLLELSQKAVELYLQKAPEQKRLIISKLFKQLIVKKGEINVAYTSFTEAIAEEVLLTTKLMETR